MQSSLSMKCLRLKCYWKPKRIKSKTEAQAKKIIKETPIAVFNTAIAKDVKALDGF